MDILKSGIERGLSYKTVNKHLHHLNYSYSNCITVQSFLYILTIN